MVIIKTITRLGFLAGSLFFASFGNAALSCKDVTYGNDNYFDNMEILAVEARFRDGYFHRHHESVVSELCNKNLQYTEWLIEAGFVSRSEVQSIKEVLGLDEQYLRGLRYQSIRNKFIDMGISTAGAGNATNAYINEPSSKCGKLAKSALQGNNYSIMILRTGSSGVCN